MICTKNLARLLSISCGLTGLIFSPGVLWAKASLLISPLICGAVLLMKSRFTATDVKIIHYLYIFLVPAVVLLLLMVTGQLRHLVITLSVFTVVAFAFLELFYVELVQMADQQINILSPIGIVYQGITAGLAVAIIYMAAPSFTTLLMTSVMTAVMFAFAWLFIQISFSPNDFKPVFDGCKHLHYAMLAIFVFVAILQKFVLKTDKVSVLIEDEEEVPVADQSAYVEVV